MQIHSLFDRCVRLARSHAGVFPFALAMAILVELPLILFPFFAGPAYRGINIAQFGSDQHFYLSRGREVLDGHGLGNVILREGKDAQDPYFTWNERVLLAPYRWLGVADRINVATLYTAMNAVGIFMLFFLIYAFVYQLSGNKLLSCTTAAFVIGGSSLVFYRKFFYEDMNLYGRAMSPYLSSIGLFIYLNALLRCLVRPRARTIAIAIVAFGALFYVYLYAWIYALALNGILLAVFLLRRDWEKGKRIAFVMAGGLLLGLYNLSHLFGSLVSDASRSVRYFHFVQHSRAFLFSNVGAVLLVLFAVYWRKNRTDERLPIIVSFVLTGWVVLNQQLITGLLIQPGHFYWYFVVPLGIVFGLWMMWEMLKPAWRPFFCITLLLAAFVSTAIGQYRSTLRTIPVKLEEQRFKPILEALQKDQESSVVLAAGNGDAYLYIIYTKHDLFWHDTATYYHPEEERMKRALSVFLLLSREARTDLPEFLRRTSEDAQGSTMYASLYQALEGFTSGMNYDEYLQASRRQDAALLPHRQALREEVLRDVEKMISDPNALKELLDRQGVEYVVWDAKKYPDWDLSVLSGLREIVSADDLHLYRRE